MTGITATRQAPLARPTEVVTPESLEETVYGRRYVDQAPATRYDFLVVGATEAGIAAASEAARLGARVALLDRELPGPGGSAALRVPPGALVRSARALADARLACELGLSGLDDAWFDYSVAVSRARAAAARLAERHHPKRLRDLGIELFVGEVRFTTASTLTLDRRGFSFRKACLATGGRFVRPAIQGLDETGFLTPDTLHELTVLPARLAVLGAGAEGCELAQAFARFGSTVTLVDPAGRILPTEDADAAAVVRRALVEDGVRVLEGFEVHGAELIPGARRLYLADVESGAARPLDVDAILVAVGRAPELRGISLERAEVLVDARGIEVDERLTTSNPRIFAAGDVATVERPAPEVAQARVAVHNALCLGRTSWRSLVVPRCVLTDPEVVHVGLRRRQAEQQGLSVETFRTDLSGVERAVLDGEDTGLLKLHTLRKSGILVGATLVSRHASESLDALTLAVREGMRIDQLTSLVRPRPTQAAAISRAADPFVPRHVPLRLARWVEALLSLRRRWTRRG